ncbi:hypothetical protein [Arthrobacter sp. KNU40]|uniref:hypothetical protein n=1 Tax=Arthrobacter sp. KNU40 TaxID=3447965 RepID=UPI003F64439D
MNTTPEQSPYPSRSEVTGTRPQLTTIRTDPLLMVAVAAYQKHHKALYGFEPSRGSILSTSVLQHNDYIRREYNKLKRENIYEKKKYLDGIKTPKHSVFTEDFDNF